jgi:hypothetical protein
MGIHKKQDAIQKQKCSIDDKMNGNTHTTINIPPRVCSVSEEKLGKKTTVLDGRRQRQTE